MEIMRGSLSGRARRVERFLALDGGAALPFRMAYCSAQCQERGGGV